jgi:hypothetical protein
VKFELFAMDCRAPTAVFLTTSLKGAPPITPAENTWANTPVALRKEIRISLRIHFHSTLGVNLRLRGLVS